MQNLQKTTKSADFIGETSQEKIYINCQKGWINPHELKDKETELYIVPK